MLKIEPISHSFLSTEAVFVSCNCIEVQTSHCCELVLVGKLKLDRASLLCLRMIQVTMEKEDAMMYTQQESGASTFISSMDKLLMAINPRSGKPDHLVNIAK